MGIMRGEFDRLDGKKNTVIISAQLLSLVERFEAANKASLDFSLDMLSFLVSASLFSFFPLPYLRVHIYSNFRPPAFSASLRPAIRPQLLPLPSAQRSTSTARDPAPLSSCAAVPQVSLNLWSVRD